MPAFLIICKDIVCNAAGKVKGQNDIDRLGYFEGCRDNMVIDSPVQELVLSKYSGDKERKGRSLIERCCGVRIQRDWYFYAFAVAAFHCTDIIRIIYLQ